MYLVGDDTNTMRIMAVAVFGLLVLPGAKADQVRLTVTPDKCVTLRQGQTCYQTLQIEFEAMTTGDYCLKIVGQPSAIQCWSDVNSAQHRYALASDRAVDFEIVNGEQVTLAAVHVVVSWVYKQSRHRSRSGWRLF